MIIYKNSKGVKLMNKTNYLNMRILMFISSYFPLYIMLLILNVNRYNSVNKILGLIKGNNNRVFIFVITLIFLIILSFVSLYDLKRTSWDEYCDIGKIERPDDTVISYMMTYIIPLLTTDNLTNEIVIINIFLFILIGYLYIRLNLIYLNPLWSIFGYIMYKTDNDMILITNIPYSRIKSLNNNTAKGTLLGGNIYLIQKDDNDF